MKRAKLGGDEQDAFTRWRKYIRWKPGQIRKLKRQSAKRERRTAAAQARNQRDD